MRTSRLVVWPITGSGHVAPKAFVTWMLTHKMVVSKSTEYTHSYSNQYQLSRRDYYSKRSPISSIRLITIIAVISCIAILELEPPHLLDEAFAQVEFLVASARR